MRWLQGALRWCMHVARALLGRARGPITPAAPAPAVPTVATGVPAESTPDVSGPRTRRRVPRGPQNGPRYIADGLRRRAAPSRAAVLAKRLRAQRREWQHVILLIDGPDDSPYNPHTVDAVRDFVSRLLPGVPAAISLERSARLRRGGLHLHLVVPGGAPELTERQWFHHTPDGVIVRATRHRVIPVRDTDADLARLLRYLHKPAHAGARWWRAHGPLPAQYRAAEAALEAGQAMCRNLGLPRLRRTFWTQHLPRQPCAAQVQVAAPPHQASLTTRVHGQAAPTPAVVRPSTPATRLLARVMTTIAGSLRVTSAARATRPPATTPASHRTGPAHAPACPHADAHAGAYTGVWGRARQVLDQVTHGVRALLRLT